MDPIAKKKQQEREFISQQKMNYEGVVSPMGSVESPYGTKYTPTIPMKVGKIMSNVGNSIRGLSTKLLSTRLPQVKTAQAQPMELPKVPQAVQSPTPTQAPQVTPTPSKLPKTYYNYRNATLNPGLYDSIVNSGASPEEQQMLMALGTQESGGGYTTIGDNGLSHGPYHIHQNYRKDITPEQARDPQVSTQYVLKEMRRNVKSGIPLSSSLKSWNSKSGYVNNGPKYDVDIPQMATTSSFRRGK